MYHMDPDLVWARLADIQEDVVQASRLARLLHDDWREYLPCLGGGR